VLSQEIVTSLRREGHISGQSSRSGVLLMYLWSTVFGTNIRNMLVKGIKERKGCVCRILGLLSQ
jgi:hypothetical protein